MGKDLLTNVAGGMLSGANNGGHAEGTTKAAVSEGMLIIRDADKQQQDVAQLNHDTGHANDGSISPIFNKEKEQNRLKQAQLIGEIGDQAMDVIRTRGEIAGLKAQTDPDALAQARGQLEKSGKPASDADVMRRAYDNAMKQYGTGSDLQKAAQAVTGALTALAGNNLAGALASGASPYLATEIKRMTTHPLTGEVDVAANAMAHAVLGAVTAQLSNQSAVAGGLGAGGGELAARVIADKLFHADTPEKIARLSESEKQQVSALSQLASGLAGGLATSDTAGAVTGGQAGKNAVENNSLSGDKARETVKQAAESLKNQVRDKLGEGTTSSIANAIINGLADTGDTALGGVDYAADAAMALASCAAGDSYCGTAMNDLAGKNQAVADSVKALMQSETWSAVADTIKQASEGNQAALEATGGILAGILLPGKKIPGVVKAVDPNIKIATGATVGDFEASLFKLPPGERVALVKQTTAKVVAEHGLIKDNKLTKMNNRDVYRGTDGNLYALDTQHGRFEVVTPQGKHVMEVNFAMKEIPDSKDKSGGHNLRVK